MLKELVSVLDAIPVGEGASIYRDAVLQRNILGKATDSTRHKSLRHLRELYALDESTPLFSLLRKLHGIDATSLPLLAVQVAWTRDPLLRATTLPVLDASVGERVETGLLADSLEITYPNQYSLLNRNKIARNAASSWTQSGHLAGRAVKIRRLIQPTAVSVAMALFLGDKAGYHGAEVFSNPWCRLLDLSSERAKAFGFEAHRAGLLNLRAVGEIVELSFPLLTDCLGKLMSAIDYLFANYARHIRLPWSANMAGAQRVWFAVYPPAEERRLRARLPQFEATTLEAGHSWNPVDFTKLMPEFLASHRYRDEIFKQPQHLRIGNVIEKSACALIKDACSIAETPASSVIALTGLASLFDLMRVSSLIEAVEDSVPGRLLVFFPGEYAGNVYRFMDARDGFNYMAVPITSTESFINP